MASLIPCPHCGARPREEFAVKGDAAPIRPEPDAPASEWHEYLHLRDNPKGLHREFWHHVSGCRRWLIVERDTVSHEIHAVTDAASVRRGGGA